MNVYAQHRQRHHEQPRQVARHPDPLRATTSVCRPRPSSATGLTSCPRSMVGGAVVIKLLEGHAGHRRHPGALAQGRRSDHRTLHARTSGCSSRPSSRRQGRDIRASSSATVSSRRCGGWRRAMSSVQCPPRWARGAGRVGRDLSGDGGAGRADHGLRVAGVDMLEGNDGPLVMGGQLLPGLRASVRDQPRRRRGVIDHIANRPASPRSTCATSDGVDRLRVAELVVTRVPTSSAKSLGESGLRDRVYLGAHPAAGQP